MFTEDDTEKLADYRAGRLSQAEMAAFEARLGSDPEAAAWAGLADRIAEAEADTGTGPGEFGWARLSRSIDAEASAAPARRRGWQVPAWQAAAAMVLGIGLWQAAIAPQFGADDGYVTASGDAQGIVRVAFAADASQADITVLLRDAGAQIVAGPSAIGLYTLAPADGEASTLADLLTARPDLVESATLP